MKNTVDFKYLNDAISTVCQNYEIIKIIRGVIIPAICQTEAGEVLILRRRSGNKIRYSIHNLTNN